MFQCQLVQFNDDAMTKGILDDVVEFTLAFILIMFQCQLVQFIDDAMTEGIVDDVVEVTLVFILIMFQCQLVQFNAEDKLGVVRLCVRFQHVRVG